MRVTSKGQVTIPKNLRDELCITNGSIVEFALDGDGIRITKTEKKQELGRRLVSDLRGLGDIKMSTDEIMALTRGE